MLPTDLSPLSCAVEGRRPGRPAGRAHHAPPRGFVPLRGTPSEVRFGGAIPVNRGRTYAQKLGLRFEQRVHDVLSAIYGASYRSSPSILYRDRSGLRRAIPDGLLDLGPRIVIVEVKYSHCERAWWQLTQLYGPLLTRLDPRPIDFAEIVHTFDPDIRAPGAMILTQSLHRLPLSAVGVLQWQI